MGEAGQKEFLSSPGVAETMAQAGRPLSVKYELKVLFAIFSA